MSTTLKHFVSVRSKKYFHVYLSLCVPVCGVLFFAAAHDCSHLILTKVNFMLVSDASHSDSQHLRKKNIGNIFSTHTLSFLI